MPGDYKGGIEFPFIRPLGCVIRWDLCRPDEAPPFGRGRVTFRDYSTILVAQCQPAVPDHGRAGVSIGIAIHFRLKRKGSDTFGRAGDA